MTQLARPSQTRKHHAGNYRPSSLPKIFVNHMAQFIHHYFSAIQITLMAGCIGILVLPALAFHHIFLAIILLLLSVTLIHWMGRSHD